MVVAVVVGRKREKISAYHVSVSRSRLGTRRGFSIMDKLLIRWERWPTLPSICVCLCLHSAHPLPPRELASRPRRVLFSLTGQLPPPPPPPPPPENAQTELGFLAWTTFHFNYSIDSPPPLVYCRLLLSFPSSLLFVFPGSLSAASEHRIKSCTRIS